MLFPDFRQPVLHVTLNRLSMLGCLEQIAHNAIIRVPGQERRSTTQADVTEIARSMKEHHALTAIRLTFPLPPVQNVMTATLQEMGEVGTIRFKIRETSPG